MGNCACAKLCHTHRMCLKKQSYNRPLVRVVPQKAVPDKRVGWKSNLVDEYMTIETKSQQCKTKFNTDEQISPRDKVQSHRKKKKRERKKEVFRETHQSEEQTALTILLKNSSTTDDIKTTDNSLTSPSLGIFGKRHSVSPLYNNVSTDRSYLLLKPTEHEWNISQDQTLVQPEARQRRKKKGKKHKEKQKEHMSSCNPDKFLTDDTVHETNAD